MAAGDAIFKKVLPMVFIGVFKCKIWITVQIDKS
jgi:hypothetical protein